MSKTMTTRGDFAVGFADGFNFFHVHHNTINQAEQSCVFQSIPPYTTTQIMRNSFNMINYDKGPTLVWLWQSWWRW